MANQLCFRCFKVKGDYEVCPHCGFVENSEAEQACQLKPGTILNGRYIIGVSIGIGGFGITYRSFDTVLGVVVAIKEFYPAGLVSRAAGETKVGIFSGDKVREFERQKQRFLEEAKNMAIFSREKDIVNVYDYFEANETAYIIMEFIDGQLLKTRLEEGKPMPAAEATGYILAILDALAKVHRNGIIHRDVSPDNIFLTGEKTIKLFDFGAAKFQGTETERSEAAVVKAGYTPPEQYRSQNEQGPFMDVYAAGAVFYQMLTGEKPLEAPDRGMEDDLKSPAQLGVEIDPNLDRIVMKAMALKVDNRFKTVEQFKDAIITGKKVRIEERSGRMKMLLIGAEAIIAVAVVLAVASVVHNIAANKDKIDTASVSGETVDVWICVPQEDQQSGGENTEETGESQEKTEDKNERVKKQLLESVAEDYPGMKVNVTCLAPEEYETKLKDARGKKELPDVFCTDSMNEPQDYCCSLKPLLKTVDTGKYYFWEKSGDTVELPSTFQVAVSYWAGDTARPLECKDIQTMKFSTDVGQWDGAVPLVSSMADLPGVQSYMLLNEINAVPFSVAPVYEDGKMIGNYRFCYGVNKDAPEKERQAGMLVLAELCGDSMQNILYLDNEEGIPVNRETYKTYEQYKFSTYFSFMKKKDPQEIIIGEGKNTDVILSEKIKGVQR